VNARGWCQKCGEAVEHREGEADEEMKIATTILVTALAPLVICSATSAPLLLRPPFPANLDLPEPLPPPPVLSRHHAGSFICFIEDIDASGNVSLVATLYQSGLPEFDHAPKTYPDETGYRHGAKLLGRPIAVRMITTILYDPNANAVADLKCSWSAYDVWHAAHPRL